MKTKTLVKTLSLLVLLALPASLSACGFSSTAAVQPETPVLKPAVQTVELILTRTSPAGTPPPQSTPTPVSTVASVEFTQPPRSASSQSGQTVLSAIPCDLVAPGRPIDVTVEDGEIFQPGQVFSKTWRLVNAGDCAWTRGYSVVFFSGQPMGLSGQQSLTGEVQPGSVIDVTVDMVAPEIPGSYQSNWKLRNENGELFGLGPNGDAPFWVQISVVQVGDSETPTSSPSLTPELPVYSSGVITIRPAEALDLDSGGLNQDDFVDLTYVNETLAQPALSPTNGARLSVYGTDQPDELACQTAALREDTLDLADLRLGVYLCYRTSLGLPGYLRVTQALPDEPGLSLDFVTWTVP